MGTAVVAILDIGCFAESRMDGIGIRAVIRENVSWWGDDALCVCTCVRVI